jgi:hypothetical protein
MVKPLNSSLLEHDSLAELNRFLKEYKKYLILGTDAESPRKFYSILVTDVFCIGIIASHFGIKPSILISDDSHVVFVGHDCVVSIVEASRAEIESVIALEGVFFEFANIHEEPNALIVLHELGALKISTAGIPIWSYSDGIIEDYHMKNGYLILAVMDKKDPITIEMSTGRTHD